MGKNWTIKIKDRVEMYESVAGIADGNRRDPQNPRVVGSFAGGPVRKTRPGRSNKTNKQVANWVIAYAGNIFTIPFKSQSSKDIIKFSQVYLAELLKDNPRAIMSSKRVVNLMQAIIRNPILRGEYKMHDAKTGKRKGFTRSLIDTGQFFRSIKVEMRKRK